LKICFHGKINPPIFWKGTTKYHIIYFLLGSSLKITVLIGNRTALLCIDARLSGDVARKA